MLHARRKQARRRVAPDTTQVFCGTETRKQFSNFYRWCLQIAKAAELEKSGNIPRIHSRILVITS
jgi:hypothetical protein